MGLFSATILTFITKMGMMQQNHLIDGVNYRADAKRVTHIQCKNADVL